MVRILADDADPIKTTETYSNSVSDCVPLFFSISLFDLVSINVFFFCEILLNYCNIIIYCIL